ncbi:PKD domain-containing protein, partial [Spirosoma migulaei]
MRFVYTIGLMGLFLGAVLCPTSSQATHVRAGEITTKRISQTSLTYQITFTAYFDELGGRAASNQAESYTICFGDGSTAEVKRSIRKAINGNTSSIDVYTTTHTYPGPGVYTIGVTVQNRNQGTINLPPPGESQNIAFFVSTTILINAALLTNSTPVMLNPPLDSGRVGQKFCHNPAAFDADGDSLAYRLSVPKTSLTTSGCSGRDIPVYQTPTRFSTSSEAGGTPTFTINPITGELCWDAPGQIGQYNFAFIIEEWRNGVLIGEITRDMQIIVTD